VTSLYRISVDLLVYTVGYGLAKLGSFMALPVLTRAFSPTQYGVLSSVTAVMWLMVAASLVGGDSVYGRYFFEARTEADRRRLTSTWIGFLALWSVMLFGALVVPVTSLMHRYLGGDGHPGLVVAALATAPVLMLNMMCGQILRNQLRSRTVATLAALEALLSTCLGLFVGIVLHRGITGIAVGNLIGEAVILPVYVWAARSMLLPDFSGRLLRELLRFGMSLLPLSLAYWVFLTSDRMLLGRLSTFHELGLYSVAVQLALVLNLMQGVASQAWVPYAMRAWLQSPDEAPTLSGRFMTYLLAGFGFVAVGLTAFAPVLLHVLSSGEYLAAATVVGPLALAGVAYASILVTSLGVTVARRSRFLVITSTGAALLNVTLNVALDPPFGGMGAAWATAASYSALTLAYFLRSQQLLPVAYEWRRSGSIVALTVGLLMTATRTNALGGGLVARLGAGLGLIAAFGAGLFLLGAFDRREAAALRSVARRWRESTVGRPRPVPLQEVLSPSSPAPPSEP
jgi:O-antigen/teichoic acid export membrane protein